MSPLVDRSVEALRIIRIRLLPSPSLTHVSLAGPRSEQIRAVQHQRSQGSILRAVGNWRRVLRHVIAWAGAFDGTAPSSGRFQDNPDPDGGVAAGEAARG